MLGYEKEKNFGTTPGFGLNDGGAVDWEMSRFWGWVSEIMSSRSPATGR